MMVAVSEYDAFGPWVYEITEEHPAPRLFVSSIPVDDTAHLLLKIPRNIERRVATPDMDLYDYVVGAYSKYICILKRENHRIIKSIIPYSEVEGVCLKRHLLSGLLTLYLETGEVAIPFNAVSMDIMKRFSALIRARNFKKNRIVSEAIIEKQWRVDLNIFFVNMLEDLRQDGENTLIYAYQPAVDRVPLKKSGVEGLFNRFRRQKVPAVLHVLTPNELIVIQQDAAEGKDSKGELSYRYFYLPVGGIQAINIAESMDYSEQVCSINLLHHSFSYSIKENQSIHKFYQLLKESIK